MLNQTGHGAQATGLASLKNSVVEELRRLSLLYKENIGWGSRLRQSVAEKSSAAADDFQSDDPEAQKRTLGRVGKLVSSVP